MSVDRSEGDACEVLVVGAGPTGLMAASLLKRRGIDVRIVDSRAEPSRESRAFALSARSLELFASLELAEKLFDEGVINSSVELFISGKRVGGLDFDRTHAEDTPFSFILMIPQARTEAVLIEALGEAGLEVERGLEVTGFEQDADMVRVHAKGSGGEAKTLRAAFVIGADGAHSIVRHTLGLSFEGAKYPQSFLLGDVEVDWALDHDRFRVFMHGERIGLFFPLKGSRLSRVMTTDLSAPPASDDPAVASALDLGELAASFAQATSLQVRLKNAAWLTRFRTHHRGVDRYREGRVFVAGDAGHIHSPAGGQGMNTGLQDAANLAWKLAAMIRDGAEDALLDTYGSERLPVAKEVLRFTDELFTTVAGQSGWRARLRDLLAPAILGPATSLDFIQGKAFRKFAQIDIAYPAGRFVGQGEADGQTTGPGPGKRAPNAQLSRHQDVFDLLAGYSFHVLALSRKRLDEAEASAIKRGMTALGAAGVETHVVARLASGRCEGIHVPERADVFERYGLETEEAQAVLLIRPDGYVAWRGEGLDLESCRAFLGRFRVAAMIGAE
ncbi:2-polyprenyl-6-methoxyphenol hydroxylase [Faunimonas pinastri]|uniref:2-polyprenyl-6-methoxyphenol hydroxylase n=1 Tax=Faunimonas pinastri TaxID=1855383 RepID=A0A1H9LHE1_9HYPH|nr:FAD-dependent monooxygenase [Faunimonas pinastri]SER10535.1 2-polyprenyl-6-methoxyphenol hydroxylase [Faunimonas pinastri]